MHRLKINIRELIILFIFSAPLGIFIYSYNNNQIIYEAKLNRGFAATKNFCENYTFQQFALLNGSDLDFISDKFKKGAIKFYLNNDLNSYLIKFRGNIEMTPQMGYEANILMDEIRALEARRFDNLFKDAELHCKNGSYKVFKWIKLSENDGNHINIKKRYKNFHLALMLLLPFLIFYLLLILYKNRNIIYYDK